MASAAVLVSPVPSLSPLPQLLVAGPFGPLQAAALLVSSSGFSEFGSLALSSALVQRLYKCLSSGLGLYDQHSPSRPGSLIFYLHRAHSTVRQFASVCTCHMGLPLSLAL